MKRISSGSLWFLVSIPLLGEPLSGAPEFALGFSGPKELQGLPGRVVRAVVFATIADDGKGAGAQSWTIHVEAAGGRVRAIGLEETDAAFALDGGKVWNWVEPNFGDLAFSSID